MSHQHLAPFHAFQDQISMDIVAKKSQKQHCPGQSHCPKTLDGTVGTPNDHNWDDVNNEKRTKENKNKNNKNENNDSNTKTMQPSNKGEKLCHCCERKSMNCLLNAPKKKTVVKMNGEMMNE